MKTITRHNDFHGSSVRVRVLSMREYDDRANVATLTFGQYARANRELCGIKECTCGGVHRNHHAQQTTADPHGPYEVFVGKE